MNDSERKIGVLKRILDESRYTVALCGSGILLESGRNALKAPEKAYDIEQEYGVSPEEIFSSVYYNNRTAKFFDFYRKEILNKPADVTETSYILAKMEQAGKMQCIIDSNIYEQNQRGGCRNVISLHGSIYRNTCPRCRKTFSMEYIRDSQKVPVCEKCKRVIRPGVFFYGEMMDSTIMSEASRQIESAETLLLLGTALDSEVYRQYVRHFAGKYLIIIHKKPHYLDEKANLVFLDDPKNILSKLEL